MSISKLSDKAAVLEALDEFRQLGENAFLQKYGFGPATKYSLDHGGTSYPPKAIAAAAYGNQFPNQGPLRSGEFSGGATGANVPLKKLGFTISELSLPSGDESDNRTLLVYVGEKSMQNLRYSLQATDALWGWREAQDVYETLQTGDRIVLACGYSGGSPRVKEAEWTTKDLREVFVGEVSGSTQHESVPYWPDETEQGSVIYPIRIPIRNVASVGERSISDLDVEFGSGAAESLHLGLDENQILAANLRKRPGFKVPALKADLSPADLVEAASLLC